MLLATTGSRDEQSHGRGNPGQPCRDRHFRWVPRLGPMASKKRRILVTGVARWWGALVVQRLVEDPDVPEGIGIDIREPPYALGRADYLKLDVRHSLIGKLVRAVGIDTVVHTLTPVDSFDLHPR